MQIQEKDLGKIVELPVKPEWGPGIIAQVDLRFAFIFFKGVPEKIGKKYSRETNPLVLFKDQDQPDLVKRARVKNKKIKAPVAKPVTPAL
jgi:hypothetical protein